MDGLEECAGCRKFSSGGLGLGFGVIGLQGWRGWGRDLRFADWIGLIWWMGMWLGGFIGGGFGFDINFL